MSNVSYANREDEKAIATMEGEGSPSTSREVVTNDHYRPIEGGSGDFDLNDIEIPYLAIVSGQGALARDKRFHHGDLVLMKEFLIPQPMRATVFAFRNFFVQNLRYEEGVFPTKFDTKEEVFASGGNLNERVDAGTDPNNFIRAAELRLAIELPAELALTIPGVLEFEDKFIARALWSVKNSNYKSLVRRLNLIEGPLKLKQKTIATVYGDVTVSEKPKGPHWVQVADFAMKGQNTPEYLEFLRSVF